MPLRRSFSLVVPAFGPHGVGWSLSSKQYAIRSFFSYWKALLVCGALKALQLYLWVSALSSCGPVITVFFEQSPKVAFVIIGLIAHSFTSNRIEFLCLLLCRLSISPRSDYYPLGLCHLHFRSPSSFHRDSGNRLYIAE